MALAIGSSLGPYEILALLGAGGMGEVYRARDTRLKRDVALKVLLDAFAQDSDRLQRFQREAELLATLNHPNIAAIYGLESAGGVTAIVLELVEGQSLADLIGTADVARDALPIARQIAEALEAAHDRGVIHRDLKPANIRITSDGTVKVLDFGLAKLVSPSDAGPHAPGSGPADGGLSQSPTLSVHATLAGVILGTAAYMSPEQARGKPVDRRTDIWAFGCVLFEMLAGRRPFDAGETVSDAVAAILKNEPDWSALPAETPPHIRTLLRRCLEKDSKRRLPHIGLARLELEEGGDPFGPVAPSGAASARRAWLPWSVAAALLVVSTGLAMTLMMRRAEPPAEVVRFLVAPPEEATLGHTLGVRGRGFPAPHFALSPDGRHLAYVVSTSDVPQLWVRAMDAVDGRLLPDTEDSSFPFWSPDNRTVGFFAQGKLKKIDVSGGPPQIICDAPAGEGGTWNVDGVILFAADALGGLSRVAAAGGAASVVTTPDAALKETSHRWPHFLPDGRHFLYLAMSGTPSQGAAVSGPEEDRALYAGQLDSPDRTLVLKTAQRTAYAAGHLFFVRDGALQAQPFDPASLRLSGEPESVVQGVAFATNNGRAAFTLADSGVLAYRTGASAIGESQIGVYDRSGKRVESIGRPAMDLGGLRLSPDERRLAIVRRSGETSQSDVWLLDLARGGIATRFTFAPEHRNAIPVWSPDSARLAFAARPDGVYGIYVKSADGSGDARRLAASSLVRYPQSWSPDGRFLMFLEVHPKTQNDLWVLPIDPAAEPRPFLQTPFAEVGGIFSPDGSTVAYLSTEGGPRNDVYVCTFPDCHRKQRISEGGGEFPRWRADGKELFYLTGTTLMAVEMNGVGSGLQPGVPKTLFETRMRANTPDQFAVAANGQRFLINDVADTRSPAPITVVLNWPAVLKR